MARLPKCPICGAKCRRLTITGWVECLKHHRKFVRTNRPAGGEFRESGCPYEVPDLRAHLAICAKLAAKPKGKALARGCWCRNIKAVGLCSGPLPNGCNDHQRRDADCQRVLIVRAGR